MKFAREYDGGLVASFLGAVGVALEFYVEVVAAEDFFELMEKLAGGGCASLGESLG